MTRHHLGKAYGLYSSLDFGKHHGKLIYEVIVSDPDYIAWCMDNIKGFRLTEEAMKEYEEAE